MNHQNHKNTQWPPQSYMSQHWDAAAYGAMVAVSFSTEILGFDPLTKSGLMCGSLLLMAAENYVCQKTRHTLVKSIFIAAMMGNVAYDVYQSPAVQEQIKPNSPPEIAPPTRA
jgi:hypothetical protein